MGVVQSTYILLLLGASFVESSFTVQQKLNKHYCKPFGGYLTPVNDETNDDSFLASMKVPIFAAFTNNKKKQFFSRSLTASYLNECNGQSSSNDVKQIEHTAPRIRINPEEKLQIEKISYENKIPGAFLLKNVLTSQACEDMIEMCESLSFGQFAVGKNHHGAMQVVVTKETADKVADLIAPFIDTKSIKGPGHYSVTGINRRWRVYKYKPGGEEKFDPHIDSGFPPSALSKDGGSLVWDATLDSSACDQFINPTVIGRMTVLIYLNDDFYGGETNFYHPLNDNIHGRNPLLASIRPLTGSILLFPQAVGEEEHTFAQRNWPLHEGSPVKNGSNRAKYVIRSDLLFDDLKNFNQGRYNDDLEQIYEIYSTSKEAEMRNQQNISKRKVHVFNNIIS